MVPNPSEIVPTLFEILSTQSEIVPTLFQIFSTLVLRQTGPAESSGRSIAAHENLLSRENGLSTLQLYYAVVQRKGAA